MAIALSQSDYRTMLQEGGNNQQSAPGELDVTWPYPPQLGRGSVREVRLREGLVLTIASYKLHQDVIVETPEREHPLEYEFTVIHDHSRPSVGATEHYFFSGSGLADPGVNEELAGWQVLDVSFHLEPNLFCTWMGDRLLQTAPPVQALVNDLSQARYTCAASPTVAMQAALQQILNCPHTGLTQQLYLESKVWELMALHLEQMLQHQPAQPRKQTLKPDDIERLYYAREILKQHLNNPPSLNGLARQVGLNEFTLKQGFRQLFGTTVFGCLHHYRMECAKALLADGRLNVTEVARDVGFANRGHFAAAFRKKFGVNPKTYSLMAREHAG
ncbi:helix-turn-helix transcriptional regulator [Nodosilinea sp. LEGE 06152]|uniref:AraC family transcriptional regulator n=1 Tax=Nodosilinea sp. LEGE 06152 TaxID=2777966 RepID=UPI0018808AF1|nr:AraC family transcriptional regulator [Nodosilinea sp. LEGE 06152]MBE9160703.1 helix-turn-helix transcriptional regulator [Nodosilinea sp. LEGE 06152]